MDAARNLRFIDGMITKNILVLGATGKTGRRVVERLRAAGADVRAAARRRADVRFDWDDVATHDAALRGADALYLVPPTLRTDFAEQVIAFVDRARAAGVRHVTFLSARGVDLAPAEIPPRAVELHLAGADDFSHAVLRPGWFMQNFTEGYFRSAAEGAIFAPTGDGTETFVHADDIADAAAATLLDPEAHAGAGYTLTGPEALTFAQVAERIAAASGRPVRHMDVSAEEWVAREVAGGMPEDYARMLAWLLDEHVRAGTGASVTDDVARATGHAPRSFDDFAAEALARPAA
jgi:uncharacterized protein YbjT (DUF2867 family)